jgi:hypothetical protein
MKRTNVRRTLSAALSAGGSILAASAFAQPSSGGTYGPGNGMGSGMMGGDGFGWFGGYGGMWLPLLLVILVAGLVAWFVAQNKK